MNNAITHICRILRFFAFFLVLLGSCLQGYGQTAGDYQTRNNGNWGNTGTWQRYNGSSWVNAGDYPGQNAGTGIVTVRHLSLIHI